MFFFIGCGGKSFIKPAPDAYKIQSDSTTNSNTSIDTTFDTTSNYDFSSIIPDLSKNNQNAIDSLDSSAFSVFDSSCIISKKTESKSLRYPLYKISTRTVRVALAEKIPQVNLYSMGLVALHSKGRVFTPLRGRIHFQKKTSEIISVENSGIVKDLFLPCTVFSVNQYNYIDFEEKSYRGSMVIANNLKNGLFLINMLDVEEYLRGVIPMELGKRGMEDLEALKAQAVAARTYTYKRIDERKTFLFDLYNSVNDQVYGGSSVEYREADLAIKMTLDLILTLNDSLIYTYYHSTCGGMTASIESVWPEKLPRSYLVAVSDTDPSGTAYCSMSTYFTWKERWQSNRFKGIVSKFLEDNCINKTGQVNLKDLNLRIIDRDKSGRIKTLLVEGVEWKRTVIGDKARYVLRRDAPAFTILRSSNFIIDSFTPKEILISGKGYGHGVGMCQMGAIGRARAGKSFDEILLAYYSGVQLSKCNTD
jgi:stage II sporulation protein D